MKSIKRMADQYQFINIHQRTKTLYRWYSARRGISLSISIREPKLFSFAFLSFSVSVYQYPSENQNWSERYIIQMGYQFINIHQRTKTLTYETAPTQPYQFINIHQRTKTQGIHTYIASCISLSISIREPKPQYLVGFCGFGVFFTYSL